MRKLLAIVLALLVAVPVTAFADSKDDRIKELEDQVSALEAQVLDLTSQLEALKPSDQDAYSIGDTWTVAGQWSVTVDAVEEISERNEYADTNPAAVYLISYTYTNLGYTDPNQLLNGLYIDLALDGVIVDASTLTGYSYPGDVTEYPVETPVGATCKAQVCIGVENPGTFEIHFSTFDGNSESQSAVFRLETP